MKRFVEEPMFKAIFKEKSYDSNVSKITTIEGTAEYIASSISSKYKAIIACMVQKNDLNWMIIF